MDWYWMECNMAAASQPISLHHWHQVGHQECGVVAGNTTLATALHRDHHCMKHTLCCLIWCSQHCRHHNQCQSHYHCPEEPPHHHTEHCYCGSLTTSLAEWKLCGIMCWMIVFIVVVLFLQSHGWFIVLGLAVAFYFKGYIKQAFSRWCLTSQQETDYHRYGIVAHVTYLCQ